MDHPNRQKKPGLHRAASDHVAKTYRQMGAMGGAGLGLVMGVLVSGPNFGAWAPWQSVATILLGGAVGLLAGWMFLELLLGALLGGSGASDPSSDSAQGGHGPTGDSTADTGASGGD